MKVSLVSTVYNEQSNISEFLNSIAEQTRLPDEVVIVDGGSTDGTVDTLREFAKHANFRLYILCEGRCNIAKGRNDAIKKASNEIIAVTDAGCRLDKKWLEIIISPFKNLSVDVVGGWYEADPRTDFEKTVVEMTFPRLESIDPENFLPSSRSLAFRKTAWEAVDGYPERLTFAGEDTFFDLALLKIGYKIHFQNTAIVHWRPRKDLRSFARQMYLYGFGDGEAWQNKRGVFAVLTKLFFLVLPIIAFPVSFPFGFLVSILFSGLLLTHQLRNITEKKRFPIGAVIYIVHSVNYLRGFISGVLKRR